MSDATAFLHGAVPVSEQLPAPVSKGGRPSDYSKELALKICELIADGTTLRVICADPDMPHRATVFRWLDEHADFRLLYGYAQQAKIEGKVEEIVEIADNVKADLEVIECEDGSIIMMPTKQAIARATLRIETRKWLATVSMPHKYGAIGQPAAPLPPPAPSYPAEGPKLLIPGPGEPPVIDNDEPLADSLVAWERR